MKAVITVIGKDDVGIIAKISGECSNFGVNIVDITQTVLSEYFAMIMLVEIAKLTISFADFSKHLLEIGTEKGLEVRVMHEEIFNSMHRI